MSTLNEKLEKIKQARDDIKTSLSNKGVTVGKDIRTYSQAIDNLGTGSGQVKLFETVETMQSDPNATEGDKAIVYRKEIQNMTADTEVTSLTFPETVVLPTAFTDSAYCRLRAVDNSVMFDGNCQLSKTSFRFDGYSNSGMIRTEYTSEDGITYTRTTFQGDSGDLTNPVEVPACKLYRAEQWNDNMGYFMQTGGMYFEGLYEYKLNVNTGDIQLYDLTSATISYGSSTPLILNDKLPDIYSVKKLMSIANLHKSSVMYLTTDNKLKVVCGNNNDYNRIVVDSNNNIIGLGTLATIGEEVPIYELDYNTLTLSNPISVASMTINDRNNQYIALSDIKSMPFALGSSVDYTRHTLGMIQLNQINWNWSAGEDLYVYANQYLPAKTQFNLTSPNQLLPNKIALGKNGVTVGDNTVYDNIGYATLFKNLSGIDLRYMGYKYIYADNTTIDTRLPLAITDGNKDIIRCYQTPCENSSSYVNPVCNSNTILMIRYKTNYTYAVVLYNIDTNTEAELDTVELDNLYNSNITSIQVNDNLGYLLTANFNDNTINIFELKDNKATKIGSYASGTTNKYYYISVAYCNNKLYIAHRAYKSSGSILYIYEYDGNTLTKIKETSMPNGNLMMITSGNYVYCMGITAYSSSGDHTIMSINTNNNTTNTFKASTTKYMYGYDIGESDGIQFAISNSDNIYAISKLSGASKYTLCKITPTGISVIGTYSYNFNKIEGVYDEETTTITSKYGLMTGSYINITTGISKLVKGYYTCIGQTSEGIRYEFGLTPLVLDISGDNSSIFSYRGHRTIMCNTFVGNMQFPNTNDTSYVKCILKIYTSADFQEVIDYKNPILRASGTTAIQLGVSNYDNTITPTEYNTALKTSKKIEGVTE